MSRTPLQCLQAFFCHFFCLWQGRLCLGSWAQEVDIDVLGLQAELAGKAEEVGKTWMTKKTSAASSENQGNKSGCEKRSSMRQLRFWWWGSQLRQTVFSSSTMCVSSCESTGILRTRRTLDSFKVFCVSMPSCRSRRCHTEQELKSSLALWDL